jgi:hypothetical protein
MTPKSSREILPVTGDITERKRVEVAVAGQAAELSSKRRNCAARGKPWNTDADAVVCAGRHGRGIGRGGPGKAIFSSGTIPRQS